MYLTWLVSSFSFYQMKCSATSTWPLSYPIFSQIWEKESFLSYLYIKEKKQTPPTKLCCFGLCPGLSWDRVHFHNKPVGLTQTSQPVRWDILDHVMSCSVFKWESWLKHGGFATREQAEHQAVRTLHAVYSFCQCYCYFLLPLLFC